MFTQRRRIVLAAALAAAWTARTGAQSLSARPVRVIVPYPAGGIVDQFARIVVGTIGSQTQQTFIVEPMPGASSSIGTRKARQSAPDGQTWLINGPALTSNPYLFKDAGWSALRDFTVVGNVGYGPLVLVTHISSGIRSLRDLIDRAKAAPGTLNGGTSLGSSVQFNLEQLRHTTGIDVAFVPYSGAPPIMQALVGGQIDFSILPYTLAQPHVQSGRIVALAVASPARSSLFPGVPTFAELGYGGSALVPWYYFSVPRATPENVVRDINAMINKALAVPEVAERIRTLGGEAGTPMTPAELGTLLRAEDEKVSRLVKQANMRAE